MTRKTTCGASAGACLLIALVIISGGPSSLAQTVETPSGLDSETTTTLATVTLPAFGVGAVDVQRSAAQEGVPAEAKTPSGTYPTQGVIDPQAETNSGNPGVLVPLAQAESPVSHWLEAVDAAGPETPLADPTFQGTVFIPDDAAVEAAYPMLRKARLVGRSVSDVFEDFKLSELAAHINSLTVSSQALQLQDLRPGKLLRMADGGVLKVLAAKGKDRAVRLKHSASGTVVTIVEPDLQLGSAVGHVVDKLLPPTAAQSAAAIAVAEAAAMAGAGAAADNGALVGPGGKYGSAMSVLLDPVQQLAEFAVLVQQADLVSFLSDPEAKLTLFAPSDKAMALFLSKLPGTSRRALDSNSSLADQLVSGHLVSGVALGAKAIEALPGLQVKSQAGTELYVQITPGRTHPTSSASYEELSSHDTIVDGRVVQEIGAASDECSLAIDGAMLTAADLIGGKAVVHVIDKVLVPPETAQQLKVPATSLGPGSMRVAGSAASSGSQAVCSAVMQLAGVAAAAVVLGALMPSELC